MRAHVGLAVRRSFCLIEYTGPQPEVTREPLYLLLQRARLHHNACKAPTLRKGRDNVTVVLCQSQHNSDCFVCTYNKLSYTLPSSFQSTFKG
jgi:hypothetical protein